MAENKKNTISLDFRCNYCWDKKTMVYWTRSFAVKNKVYCDSCITRRMTCTTSGANNLINSLPMKIVEETALVYCPKCNIHLNNKEDNCIKCNEKTYQGSRVAYEGAEQSLPRSDKA